MDFYHLWPNISKGKWMECYCYSMGNTGKDSPKWWRGCSVKRQLSSVRETSSNCPRTCFPLATIHPYGFTRVHTLQTLMHLRMSIPPLPQHIQEWGIQTDQGALPCTPPPLPPRPEGLLETVPLSHLPWGIYTQPPPAPSNTQAPISA